VVSEKNSASLNLKRSSYVVLSPNYCASRWWLSCPRNTLAAFKHGYALGYRAVEFDVMLSKDGVPILMHDPLFGRTVAGEGGIATTDFSDLQKLDAGAWFSEEYRGEPIPSYRDILQFCLAHGIWMNVEIKPVPGYELRTGKVVAQVTQEFDVKDRVLFSSFSFESLAAAQSIAPEIARGFLQDRISADWQEQLQKLEAIALHTNHKHLSSELAQQVKQAGYGLMCYTVNTVERADQICAWGVDAFCTDRTDLFQSRLS